MNMPLSQYVLPSSFVTEPVDESSIKGPSILKLQVYHLPIYTCQLNPGSQRTITSGYNRKSI